MQNMLSNSCVRQLSVLITYLVKQVPNIEMDTREIHNKQDTKWLSIHLTTKLEMMITAQKQKKNKKTKKTKNEIKCDNKC